jgi:sec-independent protein translocase protein TatB
MFDIGFWELVVVAIVALLVIGPERLPFFAREAGKWLGRLRRFIHATRQEFERELRLGEAKDLARKITDIDLLQRDAPDKDPDFILKSHKPPVPDDTGHGRSI